MLFLLSAGGFTANVNAQVQSHPGTLASYDKLSQGQFRQNRWKVLHRTLTDDSVSYEYRGDYQGLQMHWYTVAPKSGDQVILVTATALDSAWDEQSATLRDSVDRFEGAH